jgi:hypothetical protein
LTVGSYFSSRLALPTSRGVEVYLLDDVGGAAVADVLLVDAPEAQGVIDAAAHFLGHISEYYTVHPRLAANMHRTLLRGVAWQLTRSLG